MPSSRPGPPVLTGRLRSLACFGIAFLTVAKASPESCPWDLASLESAPEFRWVDDERAPIRSLVYEGEAYQGEATEVFAFYASPGTLAGPETGPEARAYPAIVLIHGGGGTAFSEWVWLWANRGYAAIAMDLSGRRPPAPAFDPETRALELPDEGRARNRRVRLDRGGPEQGREQKFDSIGGDTSDDWPLHAVSNVIRAHSLIRSFPEVDPERTAVTGISWGGYTTCLVASVDHRFRAAVPVYGCGFLFEGESVQKSAVDSLDPERRADWIRRYDPSSHLAKCRVPIFFVNGTHDIHYPLDSYQRSYDLVPGEDKRIRIELRMGHSHPAGWAPTEIAAFVDQHCRDGRPVVDPSQPVITPGGKGQVEIRNGVGLSKATLYYTGSDGPRSKREWQSMPAEIDGATVRFSAPPAKANTWFLSLVDEDGRLTSTTVKFAAGPEAN